METTGATKVFSSSKEKYGIYYTGLALFMEMVTARHILLSKIYMFQLDLLRSLNMSVTIKNVLFRGFVIWNKFKIKYKRLGRKGKLSNTKIDTVQNYFGIALCSNIGNLEAMKSVCMASMHHVRVWLQCIMFVAITMIAHNLQIHSACIKRINKTIPATANQRFICLLLLGKQFCLFINPFASLRCWRNASMAKPRTLTNRLMG